MAWRLSDFTEIGRLGAGASGRVVSARHDDTGTVVAIKYLSDQLRETPGFIERFRGEARLLVDVASPHIARLYEYVETESGAAIVMELVDGVSLFEMIRQCGATEPEAALYILRGSLLGLAAAHRVGVVHRDYKPENVLIDAAGTSKLVDFGIATRAGQQAPAPGTPLYMAPEQWLGGPASPRTDVYAATATFFECLTTRPPFEAVGGLIGLRRAHEGFQVPLGAVPPAVRELIARGMAKDPRERPVDAAAFLGELERIAAVGYGPDWAEIGKAKLVRVVAPLLLLLGAGAAGAGVSHSVTKFLGNQFATRILAGMALTVALVAGVGLIVSGTTNAAEITAEPNPSFLASFPAGTTPTLAPTAPGPGPTTPKPTPTLSPTPTTPHPTSAPGPTSDPTIGHTFPPTHPTTPVPTTVHTTTHPTSPPPTTTPPTSPPPTTTPPTSPPPTTTPPPPPPTVNSVEVDFSSQGQPTSAGGTFDVTFTVTVVSSGSGLIELDLTDFLDTSTPPMSIGADPNSPIMIQAGGTFTSNPLTVTFNDVGVCGQGPTTFYEIDVTTSVGAGSTQNLSETEDCGGVGTPTG